MSLEKEINISLTPLQANVLVTGLKLEITTWHGNRIQMSRESSLKAFTRLTGLNVGRGLKGRETALQICEQFIENCKAEQEHLRAEAAQDAILEQIREMS